MSTLLERLKAAKLPYALDAPDIPEARELARAGYIEAAFLPASKGRSNFGEERGAVVKRITEAGVAQVERRGA